MSSTLTIQTLPISDIDTSDRLRQDYGDLSQFDSIKTVGLLQPVVINIDSEGKFKLIAGGRRLTALKALGYTELHHGITSDPARPGFVFATEMPPDVLAELEVTENVARHPMSWKEVCLGIHRVHTLRQRASDWVIKNTGALLSVSAASANNALRVAAALLADDKDVHAAANLSDAVKILLRRTQLAAERKLTKFRDAERAQRQAERAIAKAVVTSDTSIAQQINEAPELMRPVLQAKQEKAAVAYDEACEIITCCDSLLVGMPSMAAESVEHVYTDIPYGINMDNVQINNIDVTAAEHDRESNIKDFSVFLYQAFRIIKPEGFCVFWFDVEHFTTLHALATKVGFSCQRWPLHWHKSIAKNEVPRYNTTKNYESVFVARKPRATLLKPITSSIFTADWDKDERAEYTHPFAKPFSAHEKMLAMFATPGQTICDPYCGEGSGVIAALRKGLNVVAFDVDPDHVMRARAHATNVLCTQ